MYFFDKKQSFKQKYLAGLLVFVLFLNLIIGGILLPYKNAQAVVDIIGGPSNIIKAIWGFIETALREIGDAYDSAGTWLGAESAEASYLQRMLEIAKKTAWNVLRKTMLNMLVDDIIKWIQGGGEPKIITDWQSFLSDAANQAGGDFVKNYLGLGFLCKNFAPTLQIALSQPKNFQTAATCTLSGVVSNIENFFNNFSNGGWKAWLAVNEMQNNFYGAYIMALDQKWSLEAAAVEAAKNEGIASSGFLSDKVCTSVINEDGSTTEYSSTDGIESEDLPQGSKCNRWYTRTPGQTIADSASRAVTVDIDWLVESDEVEEYLGAIIDAVINRAIREGLTFMSATGSSGQSGPGINEPPSIDVDLGPYEDAVKNGDKVNALIEQQNLIIENLTKLISEIYKNIDILGQLKNLQQQTLSLIKNILTVNCPFPAGVSISVLDTQTNGNCSAGGFNAVCPCTTTTITTYKIVAPDVGEAFINKSVASTNDCLGSVSVSTSFDIASSTTEAEKDIAVLNTRISNAKQQVSLFEIAISENLIYGSSTVAYRKAYEKDPDAEETKNAELITAETKQKAVAANQAAIPSEGTDFTAFLKETMKASQKITQETGDIQKIRGENITCAYMPDMGFLYGKICDAQEVRSKYISAANCYGTGPSLGF